MASSSGNSSSGLQNSGSEENLQVLMSERKRKRMLSNRESARRSRMRKQKHLDDLTAEIGQLRKENNQILTTMSITNKNFLNIEHENSVLSAQMAELTQRLESLNGILNYMSTNTANFGLFEDATISNPNNHGFLPHDDFMNSPWDLVGVNHHQPIMAASDIFQY